MRSRAPWMSHAARTLAGAATVTAIFAAGGADARADCVADCISDLCAGRGATMVAGPLVFEEGELRIVVETVVRPGSDATGAVGARIAAGYDPDPQAAAGGEALVMISGTPGGNTYSRRFPIDADGYVRCVAPWGNPVAGRGSTPADVASASDQEPAICRSRLEKAGYMTVPCHEDATACAIAAAEVGSVHTAAQLAAGAIASLFAFALMLERSRR
jgi:hypothetical protein